MVTRAFPTITVLWLCCTLAGCGEHGTPAFNPDTGPHWVEPATALRASESLNGTWTFTPAGYPAREVEVPCFWEAYPAWPEYASCPGYLDGTPDEGLEITEGRNWNLRTIHSGTYLRDLDLPDPAPVTRVRFESIHHRATVFLNDREVGTHTGPYLSAVFDVSAAVQPGTNALRVELTDGRALLGPDRITRWPVGYYALTDITGLYRPITLETLPAIYADDTFIVPSTRRMDLTLEHTLVNTTDTEARVTLISRAVDANGMVGLETRPTAVTVPARGEARVVAATPWDDPVLWDPVHPHLYTLRTLLLDEGNRPLDLREDRFGFREVWIEDGHYMLNGMRLNLVGDSVDDQASRPRYWASRYLSCAAAPDTLRRMKELNFNAVRYHQAPPEECLYDLSDELGLLIIPESTVYARIDILPPLNRGKEYVENSKSWIDGWVRRLRNHPSLVIWSVENEMWMYGFALSLEQAFSLGEPARLADTIQRPDGVSTNPRPVNWDGDSSFFRTFGYEPETVNWHYPDAGWLTIYPDDEWYTDALAHFERYLVSQAPCGVGETMVVRRTAYPDRTLDMAKAMQGAAIKAMRVLGFSDIRPYKMNWAWHDFDPDGREHPWAPYYHGLYNLDQKERLVENLRQACHPVAVFDHEYTRTGPNPDGSFGPVSLPPNTPVERTLVILNDSFLPGVPQTVTWSVFDESGSGEPAGEPVNTAPRATSPAAGRRVTPGRAASREPVELASGRFDLTVEHGGSQSRTIGFVTPGPDHAVRLSIRSSMEGLPQGEFRIEYGFVTEPLISRGGG